MSKQAPVQVSDKATIVSIEQFRDDMDVILDRVYEHNETFIIQKSGKPIAALISPREYEAFCRLKSRQETGIQ